MHFSARNKDCSLSMQMFYLFIYFSILNFTGCCIYSFTGSSVPEHLNTIAIPVSDDRSGSGEPGLREFLTERLTQRFIEDNSLQVTDRTKADAVIECTILSLPDAPVVVSAGEQVDTRRVTVTVNAVYRDLVKRKTIYERTFTEYGDYDSSTGDVNAARRAAIEAAVEKITEDILLDTVSGW